MTPFLLSVIALISYGAGCVNLPGIMCGAFFGRELRSYGKGQRGFEALLREERYKGPVVVYLPEMAKIVLIVLAGGWLLGIIEYPALGRVFALFCLELGTVFPVSRRFVGSRGILALLLGSFCISPALGFFVGVVFAVVLVVTKYLSLAVISAATAYVLGVWVFVETGIAITLAAFTAALILVRHVGHIVRLIKHTEPKISTKKDLSYKFDDDF